MELNRIKIGESVVATKFMKWNGSVDQDSEAAYQLRKGTCPFCGGSVEAFKDSFKELYHFPVIELTKKSTPEDYKLHKLQTADGADHLKVISNKTIILKFA